MPKIIDDENVFSATINLLVRYGYENTTTKAISAAANIHEATLFRRYGSKFELVTKAIQHQMADTPLNRLAYTGSLQADLLAIVQAYVDVNETHGLIMLSLFFEVARNPDIRGFLAPPLRNIQVVLDIIEKHQEQGHLRQEPSLMTLLTLLGPIMVNNQAQRAHTGLSLPDIDIQQYLEFFLAGRRQGG